MPKNLKKQFADRINPGKRGRWPGILGNASGVIDAGGGYVYVRLQNGQTVPVYNDRVAKILNLPVIVGYDPYNKPNLMQVLSAWEVYDRPGEQGTRDHHENHEFPNFDTVWVKPEQIVWLLCMPLTAFTIQVYGGVVLRNGVYTTVENQQLDLLDYTTVPAVGAKYVLIQVDNTGAASAKAGAVVDSIELLTNLLIPTVDGDSFPLCVVKLHESQVELQRNPGGVDDFIDLRFTGVSTTGNDTQLDTTNFDGFLSAADDTIQKVADNYDDHTHPGGGGDASDITYTPSVPADWDGCLEPDFVDIALDQLAERTTDLEGAPPAHDQNASTIIIPSGMGSPTSDDLQDYLNNVQSSGRIKAGTGVLSAHAGPNGTLDISEMEGMIHTANTQGSPLIYFKKAAYLGLALTDNAVNFIIITYTAPGGVPTLTYSTSASRPANDTYNAFVVGRCWRSGNDVEVITTGQNIFDAYGRAQDRLLAKYGTMDRASGATITAHATPLRLSADAGVWYFGNSPITTAAADKFHVWYKTGGGAWTESAELTLFSEVFDGGASKVYERYQNGTSLGTLSGSKYGVYWIFMCPEGDLYVILGTADYANIGAAQAATVPASLPPYCVNWARLIGRVICQKTAAAFYSVESVWATTFTLSAAVDHASTTNLDFASSGHTGFASGAITGPAVNILTITNVAASTLAMNVTAGKTLTLTATDNSSIIFTGACNLTIPTAGSVTAALLGTANVFTTYQAITSGYLTINPDTTSTNNFQLSGRTTAGFPVPYLTPTDSNKVIALDIFPKGTPGNVAADIGTAWIDIVSSDLAADGTNWEVLRMTKLAGSYACITTAKGGTGTVRDLVMQLNGGMLGLGLAPTIHKLDVKSLTNNSFDGIITRSLNLAQTMSMGWNGLQGTYSLIYDSVGDGTSAHIFKVSTVAKFTISTGGLFGMGIAPVLLQQVTIQPAGATTSGIVIKGAAAQTASYQEWRTSADVVLSSMNKDGWLGLANALNPLSPLDIGGLITSLNPGLGSAVARISGLSTGITGVDMRNTSAGTAAEFRFTVSDNAGDAYLAFTAPSTGNTATLFGQTRSAIVAIFNNSTTTARKFVIGTVKATDLIFGTTNLARVTIDAAGDMIFTDAINIRSGTTTGTKIGTATTQKIGFWNKTPVVQPSAYTITNDSADRALDCNSTSLDEVADILGTLVKDLQSIGLVG